MFTIDDLWKIMDYLKDGATSSGLSELTTSLASSEKITTNTLFENVLDQNTFSSDDYKRLRLMLIDWYSSHKTIATTQKFASDVHQLPNDHLSELFKSFGFPLGLDLVPLTSKANFFLDLVNFYKKKGTPETLVDVLDYYGFSDSDLVEYWLQKDQFGELIFRGESVRQAAAGSTLLLDSDISFEKMTEGDPHWIQTKEQIEALTLVNTINLPSKSPYFSLSSIFSLHTINISVAILFRIVKDQHTRFSLGQELPYNIPVKNLGIVVPLLHVYIATIYTFERMFGYGQPPNLYSKYGVYKGTVTYTGDPPIAKDLGLIVKEYENLISRPMSKTEREQKLVVFFDLWSRNTPSDFLNDVDSATPLLEDLNPSFKKLIDSWFDIGDENYIITYLLGTIDNWIRININSKSPSMVITMLGLGFRDELDSIINFFKPYRARLAFMETSFAIKNPLTESFLMDDWVLTQIESNYHNQIRPPTFPKDYCMHGKMGPEPPLPDPLPPGYAGYYSQYRWDMGTRFDDLPLDSMDEDYYIRLNKQLQTLLTSGSICDDLITEIGSFYTEKVGERLYSEGYDVGEFYDITPTKQWVDESVIEVAQDLKDTYEIRRERIRHVVKTNINDYFGDETANQFDVGHNFDKTHKRPVITDSLDIHTFTYLKSAPYQYKYSGPHWDYGFFEHEEDYINSFARGSELTIGVIERISSHVNITTSSTAPPVSIKKSLTASVVVRNRSITPIPIGVYNNNYDAGGQYDVGPSFDYVYDTTPTPCTCNCNYCPCNCNYSCTCNCNYGLPPA